MLVLQRLKIAFHLLVYKNKGPFEKGQFYFQKAFFKQVLCQPGNRLAKTDQSECSALHRRFAVPLHRLLVQVDAAAKVEHPFHRCGNKGG